MAVLEELVKLRREMRDQISALTTAYEAEKKKINIIVEDIDNEIRAQMKKLGVKSFKTSEGTATLRTTTRFHVTDWGKIDELVQQTGDTSFYQRRLSEPRLRQYMDDEGMEDLPEGVKSFDKIEVSVIKPTA